MHKATSNVALRNGAKLGVGGCGFAIAAESIRVRYLVMRRIECRISRARFFVSIKGKGVMAHKASAKHIDTGGALGVVKNYFRACRR